MTAIQIYQQNTSLSMVPDRDKDIAAALSSALFCRLNDKLAYEVMKDAVVKSYVLARYECPLGQELQILVDETMKVFKARFGSIREEEVSIIFTRGLTGEYGNFKGLSLPTFSSWAAAYLKEHSRVLLTTQVEEKREPTAEEVFSISRSNALTAFEDFKKKGTCGRYGFVVYDFLSSLGLISVTQEEKNEYWRQAQSEYKNSLYATVAAPKDKDEQKKASDLLENFGNEITKEKMVNISKRMIVDDYFRSCVLEEIDLSSLIK